MGPIVNVRRVDIDKIAQKFDSAPEDKPEEVNRKDAIRILEPKIKAMRRKGYSWQRIGELLTEGGIPIAPGLLASYMRDAGGKARRRDGAGKRKNIAPRADAQVRVSEPPTGAYAAADALAESVNAAEPELVESRTSKGSGAAPVDAARREAHGHPRRAAD